MAPEPLRWAACLFFVLVTIVGTARSTDWIPASPHSKRVGGVLSTGNPKPPQTPIVFGTDTIASLTKTRDAAIAAEKALVEQIIQSSKTPEDATFDNTIKPYANHAHKFDIALVSVTGYGNISPNKDFRKFAQEAGGPLGDASSATFQNQELFKRVDYVYQTQQKHPDPKLSAEDRLYLERHWSSFQNNALHLPKDQLEHFKNISAVIGDAMSNFGATVNEDTTTLWLTEAELDGVGQDALNGLEKGKGEHEGKLKLDFASPDVTNIRSDIKNETIRRLMDYTAAQTAPANLENIKKLIKFRDEQARMLNYTSFAAMNVRHEMAKTPETVLQMLESVRQPLLSKLAKENERIKERKKKETGDANSKAWSWDIGYYINSIWKNEEKLDRALMQEWFPADYTFAQILKLYEEIFALKFTAITGKDLDDISPTKKGSDLFWAPNVTLYSVWDDADDGKGEFIGFLYVDLYYREGKGPGAYMWPMVPGFTKADGTRNYPSVGLFCNFKLSNSLKPQLIPRGDIATILHEAGHATHALVSKTKYGRFHGTAGPMDWVEMPSQLMENFNYVPAVMKRLSKHWSYLSPEALKAWQTEQKQANKDTTQPEEQFPDEFIKRILETRNAWSAGGELYQVFTASYDYQLHHLQSHADADKIDSSELFNKGDEEATQLPSFDDLDPNVPGNKEVGAGQGYKWGHSQTTFTHIFSGGYAAKYYAYTWSKINCKDVFYTKFAPDPFSRAVGTQWRKTVLEPGGTKDYDQLLEEFLGRKPNNKAFLREIGVQV